jgi:hypothetical protein
MKIFLLLLSLITAQSFGMARLLALRISPRSLNQAYQQKRYFSDSSPRAKKNCKYNCADEARCNEHLISVLRDIDLAYKKLDHGYAPWAPAYYVHKAMDYAGCEENKRIAKIYAAGVSETYYAERKFNELVKEVKK